MEWKCGRVDENGDAPNVDYEWLPKDKKWGGFEGTLLDAMVEAAREVDRYDEETGKFVTKE